MVSLLAGKWAGSSSSGRANNIHPPDKNPALHQADHMGCAEAPAVPDSHPEICDSQY